MEAFYTDYSSTTNPSPNTTGYNNEDGSSSDYIVYVVTCIIIAISFPVTLSAIYAVSSLLREDNGAPVYVINLLITDIIQLCSMIGFVTDTAFDETNSIFFYIYNFGLLANVGFIVCVALERYLVIAWPVWYRFRRTIKISLMVSVVVWILPLVYILPHKFNVDFQVRETIFAVFLLLPCPLLIFFLAGTIKALSAAISVPPDEKRRIVALLVLVLLIYTLLFLPDAMWSLVEKARENRTYSNLSYIIVLLSPFADSFLYVLLRKGAVDKVLVSLCCCRMDGTDISRSTELTVS